MFALAGLGNTVYHPADYALLSRHIPAARTGRAFSFHTFAGMLGNAAAPPSLLFLQSLVGWRGAFLGAAVLGLVAALVMALAGEPPELAAAPGKTNARGGKPADTAALGAAAPAGTAPMGWRLLLTPAILLNLAFFIMLAMSSGALYNFLVPALGALHGTPVTVGNAALTGLLLLSPIGVLVGGWLAGRTPHHGLVATCGLIVTAAVSMLVGSFDFAAVALVMLMSIAGFFSGLTMPSRDMIVRAVTPPGAYGRVFGFVSTGFNIGGIVSPLVFGQLLDQGYPRAIFFCVASCALISIATVAINTSRKPAARDTLFSVERTQAREMTMTSRNRAWRGGTTTAACASFVLGLAFVPPAAAADFYAGKTIDLEVGADVAAAITSMPARSHAI